MSDWDDRDTTDKTPATSPSAMFCRKCGYELVGLSENRCPECGQVFDPARRRSYCSRPAGWRVRRWLRRAIQALVLLALLAALCLAGVIGWFYWGWRAEQPALTAFEQFGPQHVRTARRTTPSGVMYQGALPFGWPNIAHPKPLVMIESWPVGPRWLIDFVRGRDVTPPELWYQNYPTQYKGGLCAGRFTWLLTRARRIVLEDVPAADADLAWLRRLKHVDTVELCGTQVTDAGLPHLSHLVNLQLLDLRNTNVTDDGLKHLLVFQRLEAVNLTGTKVTPAGTAWLRTAMSAVNVVTDRDVSVQEFDR